ncbi:MAG TPA: S-adenosylmethionine:tRNA ribosyltransferase-isomerase, partial [Casimicrobiaceae bacterium]|nr:S-adenosylmethionine:tRNA ribosyltransferase-isomerase [Casimicrobiaceae bacterium]
MQRPRDAKLLVVDASGAMLHALRSDFAEFFRAGDVVVVNDAATLPASLAGVHGRTGAPIEIRLATRRSLAAEDVRSWIAIAFGAGDHRMRTEDRPMPPRFTRGDILQLGPLDALVGDVLHHPRLLALQLQGTPAQIWAGLAQHGKPIQYAHVDERLALWDVWTPIAGVPAAVEPPSAGFVLDWRVLATLRQRGVRFATLTHTAGLSSTGDDDLDRALPFDEPYRIPAATIRRVVEAKLRAHRVIAIGTTVVRALEHWGGVRAEVRAVEAVARQRIDSSTRLRVVDAIVSGTHEPGSSHFRLLGAFASEQTLRRAHDALEMHGYRTHEFGDSVLIERRNDASIAARREAA